MTQKRTWHDAAWTHRPLKLEGEAPERTLARRERWLREVRETADTLAEDRGLVNARAWARHCMVRDPSGGFWRAVIEALTTTEDDGR